MAICGHKSIYIQDILFALINDSHPNNISLLKKIQTNGLCCLTLSNRLTWKTKDKIEFLRV